MLAQGPLGFDDVLSFQGPFWRLFERKSPEVMVSSLDTPKLCAIIPSVTKFMAMEQGTIYVFFIIYSCLISLYVPMYGLFQ